MVQQDEDYRDSTNSLDVRAKPGLLVRGPGLRTRIG
jgi:hypothetical protein